MANRKQELLFSTPPTLKHAAETGGREMVMSTGKLALAILWLLPVCTVCQRTTDDIATSVMEVVKFRSPTLALTHLRIIDGTGAAPHENQTLIIGGGIIQSIAPSENARIPERARVVDLSGRTAFPGLVGMHDHLAHTAGNESDSRVLGRPRGNILQGLHAHHASTAASCGRCCACAWP